VWKGTKSRVHVTAEVVSLGGPCFLICNSLSLDVHQFFLCPHHFNRLCFSERRLVIENTNLLLQTSLRSCVCVCARVRVRVRVLFLFWGKIDMALALSKGHFSCIHYLFFLQ
jgi:hypothetical protein